LLDERPLGAAPVQRRIQKGFDVILYGSPAKGELPLDGDSDRLRSTLEDLRAFADQLLPKSTADSRIEVLPFEDSLDLDPTRHYFPEAVLRIRITHVGDLDQSSGQPEEQLLHQVTDKLEVLRNGRAS
jgi:hypothetical protein